jgi:hypothetical protein
VDFKWFYPEAIHYEGIVSKYQGRFGGKIALNYFESLYKVLKMHYTRC